MICRYNSLGSALPLVLVAMTLSQAFVLRNWQYLSLEMNLVRADLDADRLRRLALLCTLRQDALVAGQAVRRIGGTDIDLSRSVTVMHRLPTEQQWLQVDCRAAPASGQAYRSQAIWLSESTDPPRLIAVAALDD